MTRDERTQKRKLQYLTARLKDLDRRGPEDSSDKIKAAHLHKRERTIRKINKLFKETQ
jgi:hypothetical protein